MFLNIYIYLDSNSAPSFYLCVCFCVFVRHRNASIFRELDEGIFWQMNDMVVDYTLEPFWIPKPGRAPYLFF